MEYKIDIDGDFLERAAAYLMRRSLPAYELIWKTFICNQGNSTAANIPSMTPADNLKRLQFSQHHYTILESIYLMDTIANSKLLVSPINDIESYRNVLISISAFHANAGRLRDNVEDCFTLMATEGKASEARERLQRLYYVRHFYVHGTKVPFTLDSYYLFKIAKVKTHSCDQNGFGRGVLWTNVELKDTIYLADSLQEEVQQILQATNALLFELFEHVKVFLTKKNCKLNPPHDMPRVNLPRHLTSSQVHGPLPPPSASIGTIDLF